MYRFIFPVCFIIFFTGQSVSQSYKRTIDWATEEEPGRSRLDISSDETYVKPYLKLIDKGEYPDIESMLPHFAEVIKISNSFFDISQVEVTIVDKIYKPLTSLELAIIQGIELEKIGKQNESFAVFKSREISYLQYSIPTIRVNPTSNQLEKLVDFKIDIKPNPSAGYIKSGMQTVSNSVLASGDWKMFRVDKTGIFRITYAELQTMGLSNLENVSIWGHGGKQLPYWNNQPSPDDLIQLPIWIERGDDGVFNQGDYILFYAEGPATWAIQENDSIFSHSIHKYSDFIHYFISTSKSNPQRVQSISPPSAPHTKVSNSFDALVFFERNDTNLIKSGRQWFGEGFDILTTRD